MATELEVIGLTAEAGWKAIPIPHPVFHIPNSTCAGAVGVEGTDRLATDFHHVPRGKRRQSRHCPTRSRAHRSRFIAEHTGPVWPSGLIRLDPTQSGSVRVDPVILRPRKSGEHRGFGIRNLAGEVDDHGQNSTTSFFQGKMSLSRLPERWAQKHAFAKRTQMSDINMRICNELRNERMRISAKRTQMIHEFQASREWVLRDRTMPNESPKHSSTPSLLPATLRMYYETNPNDEIVTCLTQSCYKTINKFIC